MGKIENGTNPCSSLSICYFLAKDMMPYDTVNAAGFQHMLLEIEPRYVPPDRKSVATNYMPKLYKWEMARVQQHELS